MQTPFDELDTVDPILEIDDLVVSRVSPENEPVRAAAAFQGIVARPADQLVAVAAAVEGVVPGIAMDRVFNPCRRTGCRRRTGP